MRKIAVKITALILVLLSLTSTFVSGAAVVANELDAEESTVAVSEESGETAQSRRCSCTDSQAPAALQGNP